MPQSNNEEVYIPYISDEYPSSFPPGDNDEGQAWLQWQLTLNPDQKATYNRHLDEAIKRYSSSAASERQSRPHLPNGFSTKRISKEFNFPWGSEKIDERVASYIEVYKLNAAQMSRFNADREKSVARWELTQSHSRKPVGVGSSGRTTEGEDRPRSSDCGEMATIGDEDDDEIYSDDSDITIRG